MSDQLRMTGIRNVPINDHSGNTDIHSKSISNLPDLEGFLRKRKLGYRNQKDGIRHNIGIETEPEDTFENDGLPDIATLKHAVTSKNGITDAHLNFGSLVNLPEIRKTQIQNKMEINNGLKVIHPQMIQSRRFRSNIKNKRPENSTPTTMSSLSSTPASTEVSESSDNLKYTQGHNVSGSLDILKSTQGHTDTTTVATRETSAASSEETAVTTYNGTERTEYSETTESVLIKPPQDDFDSLQTDDYQEELKSTQEPNNIQDVDTIIFPSDRADITKRRSRRIRFCRKIDYRRSTGAQCCQRTLTCFDNLPRYVDESVFHHGTRQYNAAERFHICHDIAESLKCKSRELNRPHCYAISKEMEEMIRPQMKAFQLFQQNTCSTGRTIPTIPPVTKSTRPTDHNSLGSRDMGLIPGALLPFVFGALAGFFLLVIVFCCVVYCRKQCKRRKARSEESHDIDSNQSSRYKSVSNNRRKSSVYEEINEDQMVSSPNSKHEIKRHRNSELSVSRKLPSAPTGDKERAENHYYLSPTSSLPEENKIDDKGNTNFGYLELQTDENGQSYAKLKTDEDYIRPDQIASSPSPKTKHSKDEYHMYFVLEKDNEGCEK